MRAGLLRTIWILIVSAWQMFLICVRGIYYHKKGQLSREKVDTLTRNWAHKILGILNVECKVINPENVDITKIHRCILMINHTSLYDIPITYVALPGTIRMLAKKELFKIPLFGQAMRAGEVPSIDRFNRQQAIQDLALAREKLESGLILWIAPEGTRSPDGHLQRFKKGGFVLAIESGATIVPVIIKGANHILPKKTWHFHMNQQVEVNIGKPVDASQYTLDQKEELLSAVETQFKDQLV